MGFTLEAFTILSGTALIGSELLSMYIKNLNTDKQATAKLESVDSLSDFTGKDGLKISKNVRLKEKVDFEGCCIVAPTGSGKTTSFFYSNLLDNSIKGSIIVIDPKGELYRDTSLYQERICKRKVLRFAPLEPGLSEKYNLLDQCEDTTEVMQLAGNLLLNGSLSIELTSGKKAGGVEWIQMAEPLLTAALLYVKELGKPFDTIENAFKLIINLNGKELDAILGNKRNNDDILTQYNIFKTVSGSERTLGSIKITLASNMKLFTDKNINAVGSKTTFTAKEFREDPTILYITFPERKSIYLAPYVAPFFSQFLDKLLDHYNNKSLAIHLLMDEFPNIGMINNMSIHAATVRSRKISLNACLQSITQLQQIYGKDTAQAILNNLKTKMVLPSLNDINTLNYISDLCGRTEVKVKNRSISKNSTTINYSKSTKKLMDIEEIRCLESGKVLILMHNKQPIIDNQDIYYKNKEYLNRVEENQDKIIFKDLHNNHSKEFFDLLEEKLKEYFFENELKEGRSSNLAEEIFK